MTFKHKLSARLARLWLGLPLFALLSLASCDLRARSVAGPVPPGTLDRVQLSPPAVTLATTATTEFIAVGMTATGDTAQSAVTWSVSGGVLVQTTDNGGRHMGRYQAGSQPGTYRVIATAQSGSVQRSDTANVIVTAIPVATVVVSPAAVALDVGQTAQLAATPQDANGAPLSGRAISWTSGNTAVATVSASGLVTAKAAGATTVTAASEGKSGSASVTVTQVPVASVEVTPAAANVGVGSTLQLTAVAKDGAGGILSGRPMTWSSSSVQIATVAAGLVAGVAAGTAYIVVSSEGKSDTATITVTFVPVASVTVSPDATSVAVDGNYQFTAILKDAAGNVLNGRPVTWSSGNPAVATVSASGLARGVATGTTAITALSEGIPGSASLTVIIPLAVGQCGAWPAGITAWIGPLPASSGQAFYASPTGSDANPGTLAAPWKSLAKANTLQPGQVLYLRAGTYGARGTTFSFSIQGTASEPITLAGYPGDGRPIIHGKVNVSGQWLRVTGLIFDGPTGNVGGPGPNGEAVLLSLSGQHVELSNSEVRYDYWHAGVGGGGSAVDYRILNNYIHDNGGLNGDYTTADAQWNTSHGIYNSPSSYGLIANNVIEHNDAKGISMRHDAHHIIIANNTIVGNGRFGVSMVEQTHDIIAANNVVMNNGNMGKGGGGISMHDAGPYTNRNNVFWNNENSNSPSSNYPGSATIISPLIADALLVNPSTGLVTQQIVNSGTDNQLRAGSPAIGYADPNYALPFDITGKCRGSAPDAGAYQR